MIKNIIFDIGNVLADFAWERLFHRLGFEDEVFENIADATVRGPYWQEFDRGRMSDREIMEGFYSLAPRYREQLDLFYEHIHEMTDEYPYAAEWVRSLKKAGYSVYILSNYGKTAFEKRKHPFSFLEEADGKVISYEVLSVKPEREIYQALESRYGISPEESVFIDDLEENIEGAERYGYAGILFRSRAQADQEIAKLSCTK
ncbi:HAD family hydrolase [Anaerostipes sp.]|uniref:HAD family hydrolase n=1 Tax=Anaerostipes sp. TaxID=1872530 RepID=UPI0025BDB57F|nr:HAD family phosphatase [Anaerostipes sp.]MBS7006853.1 HAD family phosphatase [Anaerostipes sp.]